MTTRAAAKSKNKKPLETTLGKAPVNTGDDPIDLSHLRKPIDTSIFGLSQVLQLYETATDEVRRYVTYECDIMYECRMCRTIFRSLANFILHKRNYCRETFSPSDHTNCRNNCQESELHVIQEEEDVALSTTLKEQNSGTSSPIPPKCDSKQAPEILQPANTNPNLSENKKNLTYVLRRLQGRQQSSLITEQCLSEDVSDESKSSEKEELKNNVALENISEATSGVFQTMFRNMINEYKGDMMKTQVMEIHNILENNEAILGSDGKIVDSETEKSANFMCTVCNQKFSTKKTLTYHIKYKHNNTRLVYQCPECNDTFANAWSVFRHLYKIHRKTTAQVKRLRNQIHANIIRRDQQPPMKNGNAVKCDLEEVSNLQEKMNLENQWMDDLEGDNDLQRCGGCGRKFERKAALHSHSQFCSKRIAICNSLKENSAKRTQADKTRTSKPIINTNVDSIAKGSRRRKQLISQKMCRIDYVKDFEVSSDNAGREFKQYICDQDTKAHVDTTQNTNDMETDVIEVQDDCNDSENEEFVLQLEEEDKIKDVDFKGDIARVFIVEEPRSCSRSESRSSDDVIYVDTIKLSPPIEESINLVESASDENAELKAKTSPIILKNNIITRSMKNARKSPIQKNLNNFAVQSTDICVPFLTDIVSIDNEKSCKTTPQDCSNINRKQPDQNHCTESNKRKETDPLPGNSKRKKAEVTLENAQIENPLTCTPRISLETKSLKFVDKQKRTCLSCNKRFKSNRSLMKHMAFHFNWHRYQCAICSFMSYSRSKCDRHIEIKHSIHDDKILKKNILHIPHWKTVAKSTEFTERCKKCKVKNEQALNRNASEEKLPELHNTDEEMEEEEHKDESTSSSNSQGALVVENCAKLEAVTDVIPPLQADENGLRKMIMQVIFGNQEESATQEEKESTPEENESSTQEEKEASTQEEKEASTQEEKASSTHGERESSIPEENEPSTREEREASPQEEKVSSTQAEKECSTKEEKECLTQEGKDSSTQAEKESSTKEEKESSTKDEKESATQGKASEEVQEEKASEEVQEEKALPESLEQKSKINICKAEDTAEDFLGFQNCAEVENPCKIGNPAVLGVRDHPRPVRNRVPTVQKDFLYDMAQILKPKLARDKEIDVTASHRDVDSTKKEKQKSVKMCAREPKPKNTIQLCPLNSKKLSTNTSVEHVQEPCTDLVQDINMNSKDLKKHVTGDCD